MRKQNLAILASGSGTNAENITKAFHETPDLNVSLIATNKPSAKVLERAERLGIESRIFSKTEMDSGILLDILKDAKIDFIILAGFLLKIPANLLIAFPDRIINIHPALLPRFGGKGMYGDRVHQSVIAEGEKKSGITIHLVNEEYDKGKFLFQAECDVLPEDTPDKLAKRIHALEYVHFPVIIKQYILEKASSN